MAIPIIIFIDGLTGVISIFSFETRKYIAMYFQKMEYGIVIHSY